MDENKINILRNETIGYIGSSICLAAILIAVIAIIYKYLKLERKDRIEFLSTFKKGQCFYIYVATIPMFLFGLLYAENFLTIKTVFLDILQAINSAATLIAFNFNYQNILKLMEANPLYNITVFFSFALTVLNAGMFIVSLMGRSLSKKRTVAKWRKAKSKVLLIGNNSMNYQILASAKDRKDEFCVITDKLTADEEKKLYADNIPFIDSEASENCDGSTMDICRKIVISAIEDSKKRFANNIKQSDNTYCIIINTGSDERNIAFSKDICGLINDEIKKMPFSENDMKKAVVDLFFHIQVYVFGDACYEALYLEITETSNGVMHYINKYNLTAIDFISKYPLTEFMTEEQIDYDTFTLKNNVDINMILLGFGKTNQQIFLTSVANNQFVELAKKQDGSYTECLKPVKYHIFDMKKSENNKNLNHTYYRFRNEFFTEKAINDITEESTCNEHEGQHYSYSIDYPYSESVVPADKQKDYLPLPMLPAEEYYHRLDINDTLFYNLIKKITSTGEKNINYIVIAFGNDMENIDFARKIYEKANEWHLKNVYIFAKVRSGLCTSAIFDEGNHCYIFGDEKNSVFDLDKIRHSEITDMAVKLNTEYESERSGANPLYEIQYKWFTKRTQIERDSNIYAILSLRSKLHIMGLDYVDVNTEADAVSEQEYDRIYCKADSPKPNKTNDYDPRTFTPGRCRTMAIQEHYRWNSYMISKGLIPSTIRQIEEGQVRNYRQRYHGNITTFDGLLEFYDMGQSDVIHYDYTILDNAYRLLKENGKKIIRKN